MLYCLCACRRGQGLWNLERFWRHLLAGVAVARFHRPPSGLGLSDLSCASLRSARAVEAVVPFWELSPCQERLGQRDENEAYAAEKPGEVWVVYVPRSGAVTLALPARVARASLQWLDLGTGEWQKRRVLALDGPLPLSPPTEGHWVAVLRALD